MAGAVLDVAGVNRTAWSQRKSDPRESIPDAASTLRWLGRLVFVKRELEEFFASLPGCSVESAIENIGARNGKSSLHYT